MFAMMDDTKQKRSSLLPLSGLVNYLKTAAPTAPLSSSAGAVPTRHSDEAETKRRNGEGGVRSSLGTSTSVSSLRSSTRRQPEHVEPLTRDFTAAFRATRTQRCESVNKKFNMLVNKKARLAYDMRAAAESNPKSTSYFSWGKSKEESIITNDDDAGKHIHNCQLCMYAEDTGDKINLSFSAKFGMLRKKYHCLLCNCYICGNCLHPTQLEIDPVYINEKPISIWTCKVCAELDRQAQYHMAVRKALEAAPNHPLAYYHHILSEVLGLLRMHLPRFQKMVQEARTSEQLQGATKLELNLVELFRNFDIGIKKLAAIPLEKEADLRLQESIKRALVNFLQENLALFRTLQSQRKESLARALEDDKTNKDKKGNSKESSEDAPHAPFVVSIDPAMSPMTGNKITITGEYFQRTTKVEVDGAECRTRFVDATQLIIQSPPLKEEGLKDVEVINGENLIHRLPRVLFYSENYYQLVGTGSTSAKDVGGDDEERPSATGNGRPRGHAKSKSYVGIDDMIASSSAPENDPIIRSLHPALCPLRGTKIRITGSNFCNQSSVLIASCKAQVLHFLDETEEGGTQVLEIMSPVLKAGTHLVEVLNPGGKRGILEDVLIYTDDPALLGEAPSTKEDKPARVSSSPLLTKARSFSSTWGRNAPKTSAHRGADASSPATRSGEVLPLASEKRQRNGELVGEVPNADETKDRRKTLFSMSDLRAGGGTAPTFSSRSSSMAADDLAAGNARQAATLSTGTRPARLSLVPGMSWGKP